MEAHGSARLSRKRKREGSNGEAEEGEKPLKLKRCTVVSENNGVSVCTDERWYLRPKAVVLLAPQGLKYPAPYADQLESMEEKPYKRVTMEEARRGTPRKICALCSELLPHTHSDIHVSGVTSIH